MMTSRRQNLFIGSVGALLFGVLCWISFDFMHSVQQSLWDNSVKNIMESTARGANVLQRGYVKDLEMLRMLASELEQGKSSDSGRIRSKLKTFLSDTGNLSALIFEDGTGYVDSGLAVTLTPQEMETFKGLHESSGLLFPHRNRGTGRRTFTIYTVVDFPDGRKAYLFKGYNVETLYATYAMSFYNNTGFSYVVAPDGNIAMRSVHPASNKTFSNLFDLISQSENNPDVVESFRNSLKNGKIGIAVFSNRHEEFVFCYVPMPEMDGWYIVSIVPNVEIMREANSIIQKTLFICFLIFVGFLICFLIYLYITRGYQKENYALAYTDKLTGVRNFTKFRQDGEGMLQAPDGLPCALLSINMLNFKIYNDVMGYSEGDALLKAFARILEREAPRPVLVARMLADAFLVLFPYKGKGELVTYCEAYSRALNGFIVSREQNYQLELRSGICCVEDSDASDINSLLDRANMALKTIKVKGAAQWKFYDHTMRDKLLREKDLEIRMEKALADGEFLVYIQPKYWVGTRALAGGEALVRWKSPDQGFLSPGEFIPLFEKNRFIVKLDQFMFTSVCGLLRQWLDAGIEPRPLSVNVSRMQFHTPDFVERYIRIKSQYAIPDGLLELEFTESIFFDNVALLSSAVHELRRAGIKCSIDDFGAGYSSLNVLKALPVSVLKLDGMFFRTAKDDEQAKIVIRNIMRMAGELKMATVAEGVETHQQVAFLETTGCDIIQGYVFARPMPAAEFTELLAGEGGHAER